MLTLVSDCKVYFSIMLWRKLKELQEWIVWEFSVFGSLGHIVIRLGSQYENWIMGSVFCIIKVYI